MLTAVDIVNEAAFMAGASPIQSLDSETQTAAGARLAYDRVLGHALGLHHFSFSLSTRELNLLAGVTPLTGYTGVFQLPADRIGAPLAISDDATDPRRHFTAWYSEGDKIHSSAPQLFARIRFRPEPPYWSGPFREAVTVALAASFALTLKRNRGLAGELKLDAYGPPSSGERGGKMGAAILDDVRSTPAPDHPVLTVDPLTSVWMS